MGNAETKVGNYCVDNRDRPLGKGAFGAVYKGKHVKKGHSVAIKQCVVQSDQHGSIAMKEIKNLQRIPHHKHIVQMLDYDYLEKSFWIVMEYCDRGDLEGYVQKYNPNLDRQIKIMYQCACALNHMHTQEEPIVHRDIKPANILFKREGDKEIVKIADFGLTKAMEEGGTGTAAQLTTQVGTRAFMAPELYAGNKYDESVDTFALALVFLAMINHKPTDEFLFPLSLTALDKGELSCIGQELLQSKLGKGKEPVIVKISPLDGDKVKGVKQLILDIVKYDPKKRMKMGGFVDGLQKIAQGGASPQSMVSGQAKAAQLTLSNLSLAKTMHPGMLSTMGSGESHRTVLRRPAGSTILESDSEDEDDNSKTIVPRKEGGGATSRSSGGGDDDENAVDIGYLLMRRMLEDALRKKKEEEIQEKQARMQAEQAAAVLPLLALLKLVDSESDSGDRFEVGDQVHVDKDMARAKELQVDHGGWAKGMEKYLDETGTVKEIKGNVINVTFPNGQSLRFNSRLLEKVGPGKKCSAKGGKGGLVGKFKRLDIVKFKVTDEGVIKKAQSGHGGWNNRIKKCLHLRGVVHRIFDDGDVYVEFLNGDKWCLNPDALTKVDTSGVEIEAGDIVLVLDDKDMVKQLQKGHGEWTDKMAECLGDSGIVRKVGSMGSGGNVAVVEIDDTKWTWNTRALRLVAKGEEMVMIMLAKHLED